MSGRVVILASSVLTLMVAGNMKIPVNNYFSLKTNKQIETMGISDSHNTFWSLQKLTGMKRSWAFCTSHPEFYWKLHSTQHVTELYGPCGGLFYSNNLNIFSKQWILHMPGRLGLNLTFNQFDMRYSGRTCELNALSFYTQKNNHKEVIGKLCGSRPEFTIFVIKNQMELHLDGSKVNENITMLAYYQIQSDIRVTSLKYYTVMIDSEFAQQLDKIQNYKITTYELSKHPHLIFADQKRYLFSWQIFLTAFADVTVLILRLSGCLENESSLSIYTGPLNIR